MPDPVKIERRITEATPMGVEHVGDLRKAALVEFCEKSWAGAREAVAKADA